MKHFFKYNLILIMLILGITFISNINQVNAADYLLQCSYNLRGKSNAPKVTVVQKNNQKWEFKDGPSRYKKFKFKTNYVGQVCPDYLIINNKSEIILVTNPSQYECPYTEGSKKAEANCHNLIYQKVSDPGRTDESNANDKSGNQIKEPEITEFPEGNCGILGPKTIEIIKELITLVRYLVPLIVIVFGTLDFARILFSGEERVFKEAGAKFLKRILIGITFIFIPTIISMIIDISGILLDYDIDQVFCGIF